MFQNFVICRASLNGITRSAQCKKKLLRDCSMIYAYNVLIHSELPQITNMRGVSVRFYTNPARRPSFFTQFLENIKQEIQKNKEMKESLKKFREEAEKLEQSEALRSARQKFQAVEAEATKGSEAIKEKLGSLKGKVQEVLEEASKTEIGKKAGQLGEEITKSAKEAAETISEKSHALGKTSAFQTISQTAEAVREELDHQGMYGRVYVPPKKLRKRKDVIETVDDKIVQPNKEATGVELHKDSRFYQSWQNFKDKNPYVNKVLDWKIKYEESDNPVIRASRLLTEKVTDIVGGLFQKTDLSETLTEIYIIPNILEAMVRGNLEILKDWCHEAPYKLIAQPIMQAEKLGYRLDNKILDINNVDLIMGKVMEQGPVLIISFQCQQIMCVKDVKNKIVEGNPNKVMRVNYIWVLCRDPTELNPKAAWRLLDISATSTEQFV
ncbi:Mitochondrial import inner membrane translocase subunit TIM44 [Anthophora plagiata]